MARQRPRARLLGPSADALRSPAPDLPGQPGDADHDRAQSIGLARSGSRCGDVLAAAVAGWPPAGIPGGGGGLGPGLADERGRDWPAAAYRLRRRELSLRLPGPALGRLRAGTDLGL